MPPEDDIAPDSMQPVIFANEHGERELGMMRLDFRLRGRLLFNARSEGIDSAKFWSESFAMRRCIVPADSFLRMGEGEEGREAKVRVHRPGP
jgi:putative SOS response-associated peptidase YedK